MSKIYDALINHIVSNQNQFYRAAYYYVKNREAALDVVQNAICKALENYEKLQNVDAMGSWFYRILINESLMYLRKEHKYIAWDESESDLLEGSYEEPAYEPKLEIVSKIADLPTDMQVIIHLHFFENKTLKEISEITESNLNTVKSRLYAACKKLGRELEKEDETLNTRHKKAENKTSAKKEKKEKKADSQTIQENRASLKQRRYIPVFPNKRKIINEEKSKEIQEEGEV